MQLFRAAKLISGLRLLIVTAAPIIVSSAALLSIRSAVYVVGFTLGSIGVTLWPIIATLIAISGIFSTTTPQCDLYQAELRRIELANEATRIAAIPLITAWQTQYKAWQTGYNNYNSTVPGCLQYGPVTYGGCVSNGRNNIYCWSYENAPVCLQPRPPYSVPFPAYPTIAYITRSNCTPMNCPNSKKVWLQTIWASQSEFATQTKSCFLVGYSYTILDGLKIEYNPFELNKTFLESRAMNPFSVAGNRFRNLKDSEWKNLETVQGWDKGYWAAEQTDVECRGWNPGWSRKVK
jgi:hypothetical protein